MQANTISNGPRIKQGTLLLNQLPGVTAININGATISVGDGVAGNSATLRLGVSNQLPNNNNIAIAGNGTFDLNGQAQIIGNLILEVAAVGGAVTTVGAIGTLTMLGQITVQAVGGTGTTGATISGGTLSLNTFNGGGTTRTFLVNNTAAATDLTISSAIVDGSGLGATGVTKNGFGTVQYDGMTANTYTGTTTVNDGTLILKRPVCRR